MENDCCFVCGGKNNIISCENDLCSDIKDYFIKNRFNNAAWKQLYTNNTNQKTFANRNDNIDFLDKSTAFNSASTVHQEKTIIPTNTLIFGDCFDVSKKWNSETFDMIYVDPPFGTGKIQKLESKIKNSKKSSFFYNDKFENYIDDFLLSLILESYRLLKSDGTLYLHLDQRYSHYAKIILDDIFGKDCFINHIIWSYNYGGRGKKCFPKKHDDILVYVKNKSDYQFNWDNIDKIPYKAPKLQKSIERALLGQVPTDVWEMTIVPTQSKERNGYPTQKPIKLLERILKASTNEDDLILDFCCGSGTTLEAAQNLNRKWIGIDKNPEAIKVIKNRFLKKGIKINIKEQ